MKQERTLPRLRLFLVTLRVYRVSYIICSCSILIVCVMKALFTILKSDRHCIIQNYSNDMSKRDSLYAGNHSIRMSGVFQKIFINFRNRKEIKHKGIKIFFRASFIKWEPSVIELLLHCSNKLFHKVCKIK